MQDHIWYPFTQAKNMPQPVQITKAKGIELFTSDGRSLWDCVSSWWVNMHGHAHPYIAQKIYEQASTLEHVILAGYTHPPAQALARQIVKKTHHQFSKCFFSDNGSSSVEVALKMAIQYWRNQGQSHRQRFVALEGGYHGDTVGAMSVGRSSGFFEPFAPVLFDVDHISYPQTWSDDHDVVNKEEKSIEQFCALIEKNEYAGIIVEPLVQGASGMRMVRPEYIRQLVQIARQAGLLVIFDEVMTGFGRTGRFFAFEHCDVVPDLMCLSKGLTGGFLPMSLTLATESIFEAFLGDSIEQAFLHGHSYTANPLGCAAALASLELFEREQTMAHIQSIQTLYYARLSEFKALPPVHKLRIQGSIFALDFKVSDSGYGASIASSIKQEALNQGLVLRPLGNVLYLMPPYCITLEQINRVLDKIKHIISSCA